MRVLVPQDPGIEGTDGVVAASAVVLATGTYDLPKKLGIPGEDLPFVAHRGISAFLSPTTSRVYPPPRRRRLPLSLRRALWMRFLTPVAWGPDFHRTLIGTVRPGCCLQSYRNPWCNPL